MKARFRSRFAISFATIAILTTPVVAQAPPTGYRVYSWGYFDRFPSPSPLGSTLSYTEGRPAVSFVDPWGRVVEMPLRPKVFYNSGPFLTVEGYYNPVSITVMPETVRVRPPTVLVRPAPPISYMYDSSRRVLPPAAEPAIPKARDFDAPEAPPLPRVPILPAPSTPPNSTVPAVPKLPALPKTPKAPGVPDLGPSPPEPPPAKKPG